MSAEIFRRAASLMRERAELAPDGPWLAGERCVWGKVPGHEVITDGPDGRGGTSTAQGAEHIASWHPAVALAVADWLDGVAQAIKNWERGIGVSPDQSHAFAVARAYLGESA